MLQNNITAEVVADSIHNYRNKEARITTVKLHYPRFIHSEVMTHRMFSRNSSSSRAIPIDAMLEQVTTNPAMPLHYGKNKPGMQASEELSLSGKSAAEMLWRDAANKSANIAKILAKVGLHKQCTNRLLEPFQFMNVIVTATEWDNFFELRCHEDAQPEIRILAETIRDAVSDSTPVELFEGQWHLPFITTRDGKYFCNEEEVSLDDAQKISASVCAQVSYRKEDLSLEKAIKIWDKLINSKPIHASPVEHQATPVPENFLHWTAVTGITHKDKYGNFWSGNFKHWIQYRQLIDV